METLMRLKAEGDFRRDSPGRKAGSKFFNYRCFIYINFSSVSSESIYGSIKSSRQSVQVLQIKLQKPKNVCEFASGDENGRGFMAIGRYGWT